MSAKYFYEIEINSLTLLLRFRLPNYVKKSIIGPMQYIAEFSFTTDTNTPQLARLKHGFLIKELLEHFNQKINGTLERSLWLYSAHDFTISGVLNSLGLFEVIFYHVNSNRSIFLTSKSSIYNFQLHILPYSCSLHFELYKTDRDEHYIQIFYRKSEKEYPVAIDIPQCGRKCSLKKFFEIYRDIIPGDFQTECN